ncbi:MAG TPA: AcvB/VirJ family lysyl-phosphatidylglycerol hydrolase [Longimicrobium sp.]|jgi:type IV secretory pathway VirJ component
MKVRARAAVALLAASAGCARVTLPSPPPHGPRTLPLRVLPVEDGGRSMAVILSGDGPFAGLGNRLAKDLRAAGIPAVVWHSASYYLTPRTPEEAAADLDLVIRHFGGQWHRERVLVVGYSMGADVAPFLLNRLPKETRARVDGVALLALANDAVFEFRVRQWWTRSSAPSRAVRPEMEKLRDLRVLCIHGRGDENGACPEMATSGATVVELRGGHHFRGDYPRLKRVVLDLGRSVEGR